MLSKFKLGQESNDLFCVLRYTRIFIVCGKRHYVDTIARSAAENFGRSRSCGRSAVAAAPQPQVFQIIHKVKKNWKNKLKYIFKLEY